VGHITRFRKWKQGFDAERGMEARQQARGRDLMQSMRLWAYLIREIQGTGERDHKRE